MKLGIIGFGQFGQFATKHLKEHFDVCVADKSDKSEQANSLGVKFVPLQEAASQDIVMISVPINQFESTLRDVKDSLKNGAMVFDVCSVKVKPAELMQKWVPKNVEIIASHPMFGPQSGANGLQGLRMIICPIRTKRTKIVKEFLENLGLKVIVSTPEDHDRQTAKTQALAQFLGRALINMNIEQQEISVPSFGKLLELKDMLKDDSLELFKDIQLQNPFAGDIRDMLISEISKIKSGLKKQTLT